MRALSKTLASALAGAALLGAPAALADAAGSAPAGDASGGGSCRAASPPSLPAMEALAQLQARLQAEEAAVGGDAPIVLNGRGYNYATQRDPVREMQILQAERARARSPR